jgi:hypothetical protein
MAVLLELMDYFDRKNREEAMLSAQIKSQQRAEKAYQDNMATRERVKAGLTDLADFDTRISENDFQKKVLEEGLQNIQEPMEQMKTMMQIKIIGKQNEDLNRMRNLRSAQMDYDLVDAGIAKAKSIDLVDAKNGLKPQKDTGMATVRRENVIGYDDNNEPIKETVSYKVPYTQVISQSDQTTSPYSPVTGNGISTYQISNPLLPSITANQAEQNANYIQSRGSVMFQPNQPEISAPAPEAPQATLQQASPTPMQSSDEKTLALNAYNQAQTPEGKEKIRQAAAARGIQIP